MPKRTQAAAGPDDRELTIGEVARRTGLRTSALRYYESVGVLPAPRRVNGRRLFDPDGDGLWLRAHGGLRARLGRSVHRGKSKRSPAGVAA